MTVSTFLGIISALLTLAKYLVSYAQQKEWIDKGAAQVVLNSLKESDDAIDKAKNARESVRSNTARNPASVLRDDDGFKRTDD